MNHDERNPVFWLVKQTGIKDPAGWIAFHRAQSEAMAPVASAELKAPVEGAGDIPEQWTVELEPDKSKVDPAKTSGEPSSFRKLATCWLVHSGLTPPLGLRHCAWIRLQHSFEFIVERSLAGLRSRLGERDGRFGRQAIRRFRGRTRWTGGT